MLPELTELHDIVVAQDRLVPSVWRPVSGHKIETAAGGEGDARFQAIDLCKQALR